MGAIVGLGNQIGVRNNIGAQYNHITSLEFMGMIFLMGVISTVMVTMAVILTAMSLLLMLVTSPVIVSMNMFVIMMVMFGVSVVTTGIGGWVHIDLLDITSALVLSAMSMVTFGHFEFVRMSQFFQRRLLANPFTIVAVEPPWLIYPVPMVVNIVFAAFTAVAATTVTATAVTTTAMVTATLFTIVLNLTIITTTTMMHFIGPETFLTSDLHSDIPLWATCFPTKFGCAVTESTGVVRVLI
jgi:hypothetical protein